MFLFWLIRKTWDLLEKLYTRSLLKRICSVHVTKCFWFFNLLIRRIQNGIFNLDFSLSAVLADWSEVSVFILHSVLRFCSEISDSREITNTWIHFPPKALSHLPFIHQLIKSHWLQCPHDRILFSAYSSQEKFLPLEFIQKVSSAHDYPKPRYSFSSFILFPVFSIYFCINPNDHSPPLPVSSLRVGNDRFWEGAKGREHGARAGRGVSPAPRTSAAR